MSQRKQPEYIKGTAAHRRTEGDYLSVLLNTVTLEDWGEVVANALQAAEGGDYRRSTGSAPHWQAGVVSCDDRLAQELEQRACR